MSIQLIITADHAAELWKQFWELAGTQSPQGIQPPFDEPAVSFPPVDVVPTVNPAAAPAAEKSVAQAPAGEKPTTGAADYSKLRSEIRSVLSPLMATDKKDRVNELIASFGVSKLTQIADDQLTAALEKAKAL